MRRADERCTLEALLNRTEQLLCVAPAVHRTADGQRSHPVWLGVGKIRERDEHAVFIFARAVFACLRSLQEWVYCVLPIVANIRVDIGPSHCTFVWSAGGSRLARGGLAQGSRSLGDCIIEDVQDGAEVLTTLQSAHSAACAHGFVFHEEQRLNHRELWKYQSAIPMDLAGMPSVAVSIPGKRRTVAQSSIRESLFDARQLRLLSVTWNVGATLPQENQTLQQLLDEEELADLICLGLQETCELSAKRLLTDGDEWFAWREWAVKEVHDAHDGEMELLAYAHLVGMLILVFSRSSLRDQISNVRSAELGLGVGGYGGNKGAVGIRFDVSSTSLCFVNAHLASGQEHYIERCQHFQEIMQRMGFHEGQLGHLGSDGEEEDAAPMEHARSTPAARDTRVSGGLVPKTAMSFMDVRAASREVYRIEDHDHIFWLGDTNSRLHWPGKLGGMPIQEAMQKVQERRIGELLALDQLSLMRRDGLAFQGFEEHRIRFLPSYKWRRDGHALDMRSQKHVPAWTDRILFRSTTRPVAKVHRYDMHQALCQSDHRPVFACFVVPWTSLQPRARDDPGLGGLKACACAGLVVEPAEVTFRGLRPDHPVESTVRLAIQGPGTVRFKVFVRWPDGRLRPAGGNRGAEGGTPAGLQIARWLDVTPAKGVLNKGYPADVHVSLCVGEAVLERRETEAAVVVRLEDSASHDFHLPVRATLVPSVLRVSLEALRDLGDRPLLPTGRAGEGVVPPAPSQARAGPALPPKEALAVMQWVLQQSRDTAPRSLDWWPDPLRDGVCRGKDEFSELLRYVEHAWPLPIGNPHLPPRSAAMFLLRWLSLLPEPVLTAASLQAFDGRPGSVLEVLPELPRSVLLCTAALFAQLGVRHGPHGDVASRLAGCLTQQARPPGAAEQLLCTLLSGLAADTSFPPAAAALAAGNGR